jgi:hypothetical protein
LFNVFQLTKKDEIDDAKYFSAERKRYPSKCFQKRWDKILFCALYGITNNFYTKQFEFTIQGDIIYNNSKYCVKHEKSSALV